MKSFFKNVLANIVAIMLIGGLFFMFLVMLTAVSAFSGNKKSAIKDNSVLTFDFKTNIIDSPTEDNDDIFDFSEKENNVLVYDMVEAIKKAKTDEKIKGISIETDGLRAGMVRAGEGVRARVRWIVDGLQHVAEAAVADGLLDEPLIGRVAVRRGIRD